MFRRLVITSIICVLTINMMSLAQDCTMQDAESWEAQADNDFDLGNYNEAIAAYTCMIEVGGERVSEGYEWRGISYQFLEDYDRALADLGRALEDTNNPSAYYSRGNVYLDLENYEFAIADFDSAIEAGYIWEYVYNNRGYAHDRLDDRDSAKRDYEFALSVNPEYGLAYSNLGEINFYDGDRQTAISNIDLAIQYTDGLYRSYAYENRATFGFYLDGEYRNAIQDYSQAIEFYADNTDAYLHRAKAYQATQSPNEYADYLRYVQLIQTELIDLEDNKSLFIDTPLEMSYGTVYRASFFLTSGQSMSVAAKADVDSEVDPLVVLLSPSGSAVMGDDDSGSNRDAVINRFPIAQDGIYTLLVTHSNYGDSGTLLLSTRPQTEAYHGIIPYQLKISERAKIFAISNEGAGLVNLREYPSTGFEVRQQLESGALVTILNGPFKDVDYVWWQVETEDGTQGWVVEYLGGVQILALAIDIGRTVIIDAPQLNFRAEPNVNAELVTSRFREARTLLTVIDGPVEADGLTWWKVSFDDGIEAWAVERVGNDSQTMVVTLDN